MRVARAGWSVLRALFCARLPGVMQWPGIELPALGMGLPGLTAMALTAMALTALTLPAAGAETKVSAAAAANAKLHVRIGPGRGGGERKIDPVEPPRPSEAPAAEERTKEEAAAEG